MSPVTLRTWHSYVGLLIAPSVVFFAITGAWQLFSLHEAHGHYTPPALIEKLSSVHQDQVFAFGGHHAAPDSAPAGGTPQDDDDDRTGPSALVLKWFFLFVSVGLVVSTSLGIWMGLTQIRRRGLARLLLMVGTLVPLGLLLI